MPIPTPFHPRTSALCRSLRWKDWAGYHAVCAFDPYHDREYYAFRHAAGLIDVTPLFKYDIVGPDAAEFLTRVMSRDIRKLKPGRVTYCCWCDDDGKLLDDGTVWRFDDGRYRATAAEPSLAWFHRNARGFDVTITDVTDTIAALSLQGPFSRDVLKQVCDADLDAMRFFGLAECTIDGFDAVVTRTGYSGDLGYEIWVPNERALELWDALVNAGGPYGLLPAGLDAYDMCRVEAGFIMNGVDYYSANHCLIDARKSTPYETDLGWTVQLDREPFNGQDALRAEKERGPTYMFVGLEIDWDEYEAVFAAHGLPPEVPCGAWRTAVPVYSVGGRQVGRANSGSWSPLLKKNLALATVEADFGDVDHQVNIEVTAEWERRQVRAVVRQKPFFDPPRKRS
jgi:aminomethyltransferase